MRLRKLLTTLLLLAVLAGLGLYAWIVPGLPQPDDLSQRLNAPSVKITDRQGRLLYEVLDQQGGRNAAVPLEQIPLALRQATLATEDSRFYSNPGVDIPAILRAAWSHLGGGEGASGGSTITQQVARNLLMEPQERTEYSLRRKLREGLLAWRLARRFSKDEILALYLNQMYYGAMAYGVEAAAQTYFGKPAADLDLAECALLAGLPQAPAYYNPFTEPEAAKERQRVVLQRMEAEGLLSAEQRALAEREPLSYAAAPYPMEAPHFVMMVRAQLDQWFSSEQIYQHGGLVVRTSLDLDWQRQAERTIRRQLESLQAPGSAAGMGHNTNSAALVALDPHSGEILALVGSPDYFNAENGGAINMVLAPRQPGSALKPLVYAAALDPARPRPWTAATLFLDVSTSFDTHEGRSYVPVNYDGLEHGPVLLRQSLASSLNIPAVATLEHVGLADLFDLAHKLGISLGDPQSYDLSVALGGGEVRLLDLTAAYAAFANGGYHLDPVAILEVQDVQGQRLYTAPQVTPVRVLDERVAWLISDILSDNDARRLGFGPNSTLRLDRPAAVKTGTTTNFHDNWTVGYTPDLVVGVWAGNTDYQPMRDVTGLTGAAPIWHQFLRSVLAGRPELEFQRPPGLVQVEICSLSGQLPGPDCPYRRSEWFIRGTQPNQADSFYRAAWLDRTTGLLATDSTPSEYRQRQVVLDLPPQAQPWARSQGIRLYTDLLSAAGAGATHDAGGSGLHLVSPGSGAIYQLAPGFSDGAQRLRLEAVGEPGLRQVTLWVDGSIVASFEDGAGPFQAWWTLLAGQHQAWAEAMGENGERLVSEKITFNVK